MGVRESRCCSYDSSSRIHSVWLDKATLAATLVNRYLHEKDVATPALMIHVAVEHGQLTVRADRRARHLPVTRHAHTVVMSEQTDLTSVEPIQSERFMHGACGSSPVGFAPPLGHVYSRAAPES